LCFWSFVFSTRVLGHLGKVLSPYVGSFSQRGVVFFGTTRPKTNGFFCLAGWGVFWLVWQFFPQVGLFLLGGPGRPGGLTVFFFFFSIRLFPTPGPPPMGKTKDKVSFPAWGVGLGTPPPRVGFFSVFIFPFFRAPFFKPPILNIRVQRTNSFPVCFTLWQNVLAFFFFPNCSIGF